MHINLYLFFFFFTVLITPSFAQQEGGQIRSNAIPAESVAEIPPVKVTQIFKLKYISPQDAADKVRDLMGGASGEVLSHENEGEIEVSAPPEMSEKIQKLIHDLDQERQIEVEVKVVQVDLNDEHRQGINWSAIVSEYQSFVAIEDNRPFSAGTISKEDFDVLLDALETVGETKEYQRHNIKILSGQKSDLRIKAFAKDATVSLRALPFSPAGSSEQQDRYSARLLLTPSANGDDTVVLRVASIEPNETLVKVKKDNIIVIGGIFTQTKQESTKKFPFLGDLPVFGVVFRDQSREVHRIENIIFISPHILTTSEK